MPETVEVDPYHDPYYTEWILEQEDLYPQHIPARHYLGRVDGCRWDGPGFSYEPWPGKDYVARIMTTVKTSAWKTAGNRHPRIRTALYRLTDSAGRLLYVGISGDPERRWSEHAADKPWRPEVVESTVEWFDNGRLALAAEATAIRAEKPVHNVVHNSKRVA